jgi:hypothetical protein
MTEERPRNDAPDRPVNPPVEESPPQAERPERPRRRAPQPGITSWPAR